MSLEVKENLDFSEENKLLREKIRSIVQRIKNRLEETDFTGLQMALEIIEEECCVSVEEILDGKVR